MQCTVFPEKIGTLCHFDFFTFRAFRYFDGILRVILITSVCELTTVVMDIVQRCKFCCVRYWPTSLANGLDRGRAERSFVHEWWLENLPTTYLCTKKPYAKQSFKLLSLPDGWGNSRHVGKVEHGSKTRISSFPGAPTCVLFAWRYVIILMTKFLSSVKTGLF